MTFSRENGHIECDITPGSRHLRCLVVDKDNHFGEHPVDSCPRESPGFSIQKPSEVRRSHQIVLLGRFSTYPGS